MCKQARPNIVLIFTDNQQASTLGCYGNSEIRTPHLDSLAGQGMLFENAFCPNGFCSPCRASVMTGLLPSQHGVHSWIDDRNMPEWPDNWHALNGLRTLPATLKTAGYKTALSGKYHLGDPTTKMDGFDYWCTMADGHVRSFYRNRITENGNNFDHEGHTVDFFTEIGIDFMETQVNANNPFFLYLPLPAPYGHWPATKESDRCRFSELYDNCPMHSIPREGLSKASVDGFLMRQKHSGGGLDYSLILRAPNDLQTLRNYYAQISMVDDGVGQIMAALERLGVSDNTILLFTSDHGLSVGHHGFWGHGSATFPSNLHHAAHSVPLIVRHKPTIAAGARSNAMVSNMDLYSTILDYTGLSNEQGDMPVPSRSLKPVLTGKSENAGDGAVYSEQEETRVIRTQKWAYFKRFADAPGHPIGNELYDVDNDPAEKTDLSNNPDYAEIQKNLDDMLCTYFATHARVDADLWNGGTVLQHSERKAFWQDAWGSEWQPVYSYQ